MRSSEALKGQAIRVAFPMRERPRPPCYAWSVKRFGPMGQFFFDEHGRTLSYAIGLVLVRHGGAVSAAELVVGRYEPAPHGTITAIFQTLNRPESSTAS